MKSKQQIYLAGALLLAAALVGGVLAGLKRPVNAANVTRLRLTGYAPLELAAETLSPEDYAALFPGSICLQLYDRADFRDRVSGVTLDALAHGSPIVATAGTWMAKLIEPFGAGVAIEEPTAENLHRAVTKIIDGYAGFRDRAFHASQAQAQKSWHVLLDLLAMEKP